MKREDRNQYFTEKTIQTLLLLTAVPSGTSLWLLPLLLKILNGFGPYSTEIHNK